MLFCYTVYLLGRRSVCYGNKYKQQNTVHICFYHKKQQVFILNLNVWQPPPHPKLYSAFVESQNWFYIGCDKSGCCDTYVSNSCDTVECCDTHIVLENTVMLQNLLLIHIIFLFVLIVECHIKCKLSF